jgi:hypothetical protein
MFPHGYICPRCYQTVYPDPNWREKEAVAQQAVKAHLTSETLRGKYLGGFSFGNFKQFENGRVKLVFGSDGMLVSTWYAPERRMSSGIADIDIEGSESVYQKLAAGRFLAVGVLALLAPTKKAKEQKAYIIITARNGEAGIFELNGQNPLKVQAKLSPWTAALRAGAFSAV